MEQAILKLKSGASHACSFSDVRSLQALLAKVANPALPGAPVMTLQSPQGESVDVAVSEVAGVEVAPPFCMVRDFLPPQDLDSVTAFALANAGNFRDATVYMPSNEKTDDRFRRSHILDNVDAIMPMFLPRLEALLPQIWPHLRTAPIPYNRLECQMAYHGDGDFFQTHIDNGLANLAHRRVSYVYYFQREPRQFSGGKLRLFNTLVENGGRNCGSRLIDIEPPRNSLIFFLSDCYHEVTPIECASTALPDLRLTLNGWLCG